MAKHKRKRGRGKRRPKPGKPGWYKVKAKDLLHTIELRADLQAEFLAMKECLGDVLAKYDISDADLNEIESCIDSLQAAVEPVAFGVGQGGG